MGRMMKTKAGAAMVDAGRVRTGVQAMTGAARARKYRMSTV
jgi:hypothetical protein